ncbi:MAG: aldehyde dehydrogenase family protein [Phycisphaerales bacterium]
MDAALPDSHSGGGVSGPSGGSPASWLLRERLEWIRRFRRSVVEHQDNLIDLAADEVRKDPFETLVSDLVPLLSSCKWHERHARRVLRPQRIRGASVWQIGQRHRLHREPLGLVGIIATWNYPVQLLGVQLVQALVAGNRVVVKPSERCPKTQAKLLEIAGDAGLPEGTLRALEATREAGAAMLRDEPLDHLVFTGSTAVGREIAAAVGPRLIPSTLELSGRDSAFVLRDADVRLAARSIGAAVRLNAGQTCMAPRRVLVDAGVADEFTTLLEAEVAKSGPLTDCGGNQATPTVERCLAGDELVTGDHFGPAIAVVSCDSVERMLEVHRGIGQHLATSIFSRDTAEARALARRLGAGTVTINDTIIPTAHPGAPLPALGDSGWGLSRGELGLLAMTRPVHVSMTSRRVRVPTDPPEAKQVEQVKKFIRWWYGR